MKILLRYILTIIIPALSLLGCNDTAYTDDETEALPVKTTGIDVADINKVRPMPDGSLAVPIKTADSVRFVAKVSIDGSTKYSDSLPKNMDIVMSDNLIVSPSGECLFVDKLSDFGKYAVAKLDASGSLVYYENISTNNSSAMVTMLDNGDIAYFNSSLGSSEGTPFKMGIVGNNFKYTIHAASLYDAVASFDGILVAYAQYSFESDYLIFRPDGTVTGGGVFDSGTISKVQYIGGYLYFLLYDMDFDLEDGSYSELYYLVKMDIYGNQLFSEKIDAKEVMGNFTLHGGNLITTGTVITDEAKNTTSGAMFIIDDQSGKVSATITTDYLGCFMRPVYVTPCKEGGYCVYAIRREHYDEPTGGKGGSSSKEGGTLYIYRADDLMELNYNNHK